MKKLKAPFPYFGGKSSIAPELWQKLSGYKIGNYVEPFFGSGAMLLNRPGWKPGTNWTETVNDLDGYLCNAWRAIQYAPEETAKWADWPVSEQDLHARHIWLLEHMHPIREKLAADPDFCDPKVAGWWIWGACSWIGSGWCSGVGPWTSDGERMVKHKGHGVERKVPHLGRSQGVNRQLPHLGDAGRGVKRQLPNLSPARGSLSRTGTEVLSWFERLSERLRRVRVTCGDWSRVCTPSPTWHHSGKTLVFLDPPYDADCDQTMYAADAHGVTNDVEQWCVDNQDEPKSIIVLCGYSGQYPKLDGWFKMGWETNGGYSKQAKDSRGRDNSKRETIWSNVPLETSQRSLF